MLFLSDVDSSCSGLRNVFCPSLLSSELEVSDPLCSTSSVFFGGGDSFSSSYDYGAGGGPSLLRPSECVSSEIACYLHALYASPLLKVGLYGAECCVSDGCVATVDSGANCPILSYEATLRLLEDSSESSLRVLGVNGAATKADVQGSLVVDLVGSRGRRYQLDLGTAHGMENCPMK